MKKEKYILIVDDEENIIEMIVRGIVSNAQDNYIPLVATDGFEALEYMKRIDIAAVVLDLQMSNMNGIQVCREVMTDGEMKAIPIIISSGCLDKVNKQELKDLGIKHFLEKPYGLEQLLTKIEKITK